MLIFKLENATHFLYLTGLVLKNTKFSAKLNFLVKLNNPFLSESETLMPNIVSHFDFMTPILDGFSKEKHFQKHKMQRK